MARKQPPSGSGPDPELQRLRQHIRGLDWDDLYPRLLLKALYQDPPNGLEGESSWTGSRYGASRYGERRGPDGV